MYDVFVFFFKQKTAYEMRISDWSSDVGSSDLWTIDAQPRWKNGLPPHSTTGVARRSCIHSPACPAKRLATGLSGSMSDIATMKSGNVRTASSAERRVGKECVST